MPDWERTDAEIIEASLVDPAVFEEIFRRHYSAVYRHAVRRVGVADAADLAADVFVRALAGRDRYDLSRTDCLPWLYGIAANLAGDRIRSMRRRAGKSSPPSPVADTTEEADSRLEAERLAGLFSGQRSQIGRGLSPPDRGHRIGHLCQPPKIHRSRSPTPNTAPSGRRHADWLHGQAMSLNGD